MGIVCYLPVKDYLSLSVNALGRVEQKRKIIGVVRLSSLNYFMEI